ncbi:MAG: peptidoglycan editing factor PgeF [Peptococcaceae bacterium]|nr:peptidoglycan editing factor PgeF [Peptococcaceae bacterium]
MVAHAFTTRLGGVSRGPYESLNLAMHVGDRREAVLENRRRACAILGLKLEDMVCGQQVHGDRVHVVTGADRGKGIYGEDGAIPGTDALITDCPGILLSSYYADCVPIMILDPVRKAVGVVHAGWKGTVVRIAGKALKAMRQAFGTDPGDCLAAVAPSIGPCCYEIDRPVVEALAGGGFDTGSFARPAGPDRWKLDLQLLNRAILVEAGVKPASVTVARMCTSCHPELFFSYRGQSGRCGRMASLMALT